MTNEEAIERIDCIIKNNQFTIRTEAVKEFCEKRGIKYVEDDV